MEPINFQAKFRPSSICDKSPVILSDPTVINVFRDGFILLSERQKTGRSFSGCWMRMDFAQQVTGPTQVFLLWLRVVLVRVRVERES